MLKNSKFNKIYKEIIAESKIVLERNTTTDGAPLQDISKDYPFYITMGFHHIVRGFETQEQAKQFFQEHKYNPQYFEIRSLDHLYTRLKNGRHDKFQWGSEYRTDADELMKMYDGNGGGGTWTGD